MEGATKTREIGLLSECPSERGHLMDGADLGQGYRTQAQSGPLLIVGPNRRGVIVQIEQLVSRARGGDLQAYDQIVRDFQDMVLGYAGSILGDTHLAEDAAQEAFVDAYLELPKLKDPQAFPGWLRRIVFNRCGRYLRRRRPETVELSVAPKIATGQIDPERCFEERETGRLLHKALRELSDRDRVIATLFYLNQVSQKDIGAFMELPVSTVNNRLRYARAQLKKEFTDMTQRDAEPNAASSQNLPDRVKSSLESLQAIHNELAGTMTELLTQCLGQDVHVGVASVKSRSFSEFMQPMPKFAFILTFRLEPLEGTVLIDFSLPLVFDLVNALSPQDRSEKAPLRRVSHHEAGVLQPALKETLDRVQRSWEGALPVKWVDSGWSVFPSAFLEYPDYPQAPGFSGQIPVPDEEVFHVAMDVRGGCVVGELSLCYPAKMLSGVREVQQFS